MAKASKTAGPPKPPSKGLPAVMIMIGVKPHDGDDKGMMGKEKPKPSMRGKVPGFGGAKRRTYTGP